MDPQNRPQSQVLPPMAAIGECMLELDFSEGKLRYAFGGDTLNTAVYMSRLGQPVDYITALGNDMFSDAMVAFWQQEGVGISWVQRVAEFLPGIYAIEKSPSGDPVFRYWRKDSAASHCFDTSEGIDALRSLTRYAGVYLSGISLGILKEKTLLRVLDELEAQSEAGAALFFDFNLRPVLWKGRENIIVSVYHRMASISRCVLMTRSEGEHTGFGRSPEEILYSCVHLGVKETLIKDGAAPCWGQSRGEIFCVDACPGQEVVDATAAGDSFAAAYITARNQGLCPEESVRRGHLLAAEVIRHKGAIIPKSCMPTT